MNNFLKKNNTTSHIKFTQGFVLPFTMLIAVLVLFVTTGALSLLSKQQYFSKMYKHNQVAYYAADDAISCAISIDDAYVGTDGLGIFPSSSTTPTTPLLYIDNVLAYVNLTRTPPVTKTNLRCGQSQIFAAGGDPSFNPNFIITNNNFIYYFTNPVTSLPDTEYGVTSSYNMQMDLGLDPSDVTGIQHLYRCAKVTINKTQSFRQVIAQGYSSCNGTGNTVERAVINTTVAN